MTCRLYVGDEMGYNYVGLLFLQKDMDIAGSYVCSPTGDAHKARRL